MNNNEVMGWRDEFVDFGNNNDINDKHISDDVITLFYRQKIK